MINTFGLYLSNSLCLAKVVWILNTFTDIKNTIKNVNIISLLAQVIHWNVMNMRSMLHLFW